MSGINTNNYASPVPPTFGAGNNANNYSAQANTSAQSSLQMGDKYSVANTSNAFDQAMGKLTGKPQNVFAAQSTGAAPTSNADGTKNLPSNISQEEMNWALLLEQKVAGGYKPNAQETQAYQSIAAKLSSNASNPQMQASSTPQTTAPAGPSQDEINWALALEQKVKGGYTPNAQETQAYQNVAAKLAASKSGATQPTASTQASAPAGPSQDEINWALALEQKVKGGYTPNAQETQAYQNVAAKLAASKSAPTQQAQQPQATAATSGLPQGVSQDEVNWALALEQKVKGGYTPNAQETQTYQGIAAKLAAGNNPQAQAGTTNTQAPSVTQDEVNWALGIEQKVKTGYQPTPDETAKYQDIAHRLQTQSQSGTATTPATNNNAGKDWQTWSQPFSVPQSLFQTTPRIIQVPNSLRSAVPTLPTYTAVNAGPSLTTPAASNQPVSKSEVDWALALEQKVKTGYNPNNAELAQYKGIADRLKAASANGQNVQAPANTNATAPQQNQTAPKTSLGQRFQNAWGALTK